MSVVEDKSYSDRFVVISWFLFSMLFITFLSLFYIDLLKITRVDEEFYIIATFTPLLLIKVFFDGSILFPHMYLIIKELVHIDTIISFVRLVITSILAYILIPIFSIMGGIVAILSSYTVMLIMKYMVARSYGYKGIFPFSIFIICSSVIFIINFLMFNLKLIFIGKILIFVVIVILAYFLDKSFNGNFSFEKITQLKGYVQSKIK